jgi:hypothetical protein
LPFTRELTGQVPDALNVTRIQYAQKEHFLSVYAQHLTAVLRARLALGENPWAWITKTLTFEEEENVIDLLARLLEAITDTENQYQRLRESGQISIEDTANGARFARELLAMLPEPDQLLNPHLLEPCRDAHVRAALQDFSKDVTDACETLRLLNESTTQPRLLLQNGITEKVEAAFEAVRALELHECTCTQLQDLLELRTAAETTLNEAETCFAALQNVLGVEVRFDLPSVVSLLNCLRLIETAPLDVLHFRATSLESDGAGQIVRSAADEARGLRARHEELNRTFDLSLVMGPGDPLHFAEHASALERAGILQVLFGRAYKRARKTYRSFAITRQKASRETMARHLRALSDHCQKRAQFEGHSLYRETLGACFIGVDSKWDEIGLLASWYEEVFVRLPEHDEHSPVFRELLLKSRTERLKGLRDALIPHGKRRVSLERLQISIPQIVEALPFSLSTSCSMSELREKLRGANSQLEFATNLLGKSFLGDTLLARIPVLLEATRLHQIILARVSHNDTARELLGVHFRGIETDAEPINGALAISECISNGRLSQSAIDWLLCDDYMVLQVHRIDLTEAHELDNLHLARCLGNEAPQFLFLQHHILIFLVFVAFDKIIRCDRLILVRGLKDSSHRGNVYFRLRFGRSRFRPYAFL